MMKPASRMSEMMGRYRTPALASLCAFCAAWMVMMANRYFTQSAADLEGGLGIGADDGSWLTTAYSAAEPIGVAIGCWLAMGLSIRRVLLPAVFLFLAALTALRAAGHPAYTPIWNMASSTSSRVHPTFKAP